MSNVSEDLKIQSIVKDLLHLLGEDPSREGLLGTPKRVESSLKFLTRGYKQDICGRDDLMGSLPFFN